MKLLLESGADFSIRDDDEKMAFDLAFDTGKLEVAKFLSEHIAGTSPPGSLVKLSISAPQSRNMPQNTVQTLRKHSKKVYPSDEQPTFKLYSASENGQLDIVRSLLDRGSDANETDGQRITALHAASLKGRLEVARLRIDAVLT